MQDIKLPPMTDQFTKALEECFPLRMPEPNWSDREIWIEVGKRKAVDFILEQKKRQDANMSLNL